MEYDPHELLPTIPPTMQRFEVEVSGPNISPCGRSSRLSSSRTTPGSTRASRRSTSIDSTRFKKRPVSTMSPGPTACPERLVPAVRAVSGIPAAAHAFTIFTRSAALFGSATPNGTSS